MPWQHWALTVLAATATAATESSSIFTPASNASLLWGPYRPNLYFGVRPRLPKSLSTALLWGRVEDFTTVSNNIRYTCEQHEGMAGYGWDAFDPRIGGVQTVRDRGNGIDIETSFVKLDDGRAWGARIRGTPREDAEPGVGSQGGVHQMKTSVWLTVGVEGLGAIEVRDFDDSEADEIGWVGDLVFDGQTPDLGDFRLTITEASSSNAHPMHSHPSYSEKPLDRTFVHSVQVPEEALWQSKPLIFSSIKSTIDAYVKEYTQESMPPPWQTYTIKHLPGQGNFHMVQKVFEGPFEFDILYKPAAANGSITSQDLTEAIEHAVLAFDEKYLAVLAPQAPFDRDPDYLRFSKSLFSNLVGGIGYFYGDQLVDRSYDPAYEEENEGFWLETEEARAAGKQKLEGPYELFTSIPSRPFFPRGFLWDEGFHLLPIVDWDAELVMQIVGSWFATMDEDGWIPREQILGSEARSKVPPEFQVQYPHYANPPTLYMVLTALLDKVGREGKDSDKHQSVADNYANSATLRTWLRQLYPLLQRNFEWYRKTQWGDLKSYDRGSISSSKEAYRWRGRSPSHVLPSGLDDYPRSQPPHPGELHTDLISWMGMMAGALRRIAAFVDEADDAERYASILEAIRRNVDDLHWDETAQTYCDCTIDDYEESMRVCFKGYVSIFPFMTGLLGPEARHLSAVLDLIANEDELWSPFGVRSLSAKEELYGSGENYWRSPVWINMNYLIVKQLHDIATQPGPHQTRARKMYNALRKNLVETVYRSWKETGFAWEQYNPETGAGQRTQHFTGWTSLVAKIMAMPELAGGNVKGHDEL